MKTYDAKDIRNVLLVGHGVRGRRRCWKRCSSRRARSPGWARSRTATRSPTTTRTSSAGDLGVAGDGADRVEGHKINVLDAPGTADFVGDVRSAIRAADAVIVVVSAVDGVEVQTEYAWELAVQEDLPRASS